MKVDSRSTKTEKMQCDPIPDHFKDVDEAADFWDTHDLGDYWDMTKEAHLETDIQRMVFLKCETSRFLQWK